MKQWFYGLATCTGYTGLDNIDTSNVQNFSGLFYTNIKVESFNLYNFSVAQTSNTGNMFYRCTGTTEITIGTNWKKNLSDCALPGDG